MLITSCAPAKGIEFDAVIIPNCDNENYRNTVDKNIIYVAPSEFNNVSKEIDALAKEGEILRCLKLIFINGNFINAVCSTD